MRSPFFNEEKVPFFPLVGSIEDLPSFSGDIKGGRCAYLPVPPPKKETHSSPHDDKRQRPPSPTGGPHNESTAPLFVSKGAIPPPKAESSILSRVKVRCVAPLFPRTAFRKAWGSSIPPSCCFFSSPEQDEASSPLLPPPLDKNRTDGLASQSPSLIKAAKVQTPSLPPLFSRVQDATCPSSPVPSRKPKDACFLPIYISLILPFFL